jgi:hypothetical protein
VRSSDATTGPTVGPVRLRSRCLCAFPARRLCVALFGSGSLAAGPAPTSLLRSGDKNENLVTSRGRTPPVGGRCCSALTATHEQYGAGSGDQSERRHRAAGRGRREHQFEERDRITRLDLRLEMAVTAVRLMVPTRGEPTYVLVCFVALLTTRNERPDEQPQCGLLVVAEGCGIDPGSSAGDQTRNLPPPDQPVLASRAKACFSREVASSESRSSSISRAELVARGPYTFAR